MCGASSVTSASANDVAGGRASRSPERRRSRTVEPSSKATIVSSRTSPARGASSVAGGEGGELHAAPDIIRRAPAAPRGSRRRGRPRRGRSSATGRRPRSRSAGRRATWISSTSIATAATPSATVHRLRDDARPAVGGERESPAARTVSAQAGSARSRASDSRRRASASSTRRGPARTAVDTGIACGGPPAVDSTAAVPGGQSGRSPRRMGIARGRSDQPSGRAGRAPRASGARGACCCPLSGRSRRLLWKRARSSSVILRMTREPSSTCSLHALELQLALFCLTLALRLRGHTDVVPGGRADNTAGRCIGRPAV